MKKILIYTDGACSGNPGPGGWGVLMRWGEHEKTFSGYEAMTTNNRMELTAAIKALSLLKQPCIVDLFTDSQYVQKGMTLWLANWKKTNWKRGTKPIKNVDLWKELDSQVARHQVTWHWVKGHSNHYENDIADALATEAIRANR